MLFKSELRLKIELVECFQYSLQIIEERALKSVNNCLNTNIYSYKETCNGLSSILFKKVVHFFNNSVNYTSTAAQDSCFTALESYMCCSIVIANYSVKLLPLQTHFFMEDKFLI
jgi:hypothetical protein